MRDRVRGFSRASRRNLLLRLASINRSAFRAFKGRLISITLTYPHEYPEDAEICKNHLKALRRRLQREFGEFAGFWRLGIQKRGAWHFHLLLLVGPSIGLCRANCAASSRLPGTRLRGRFPRGTSVQELVSKP